MVGLPGRRPDGALGTAIYLFGWALLFIPCGFAIYGIYLATLLGNGYWVSVVGAGPLVGVCAAVAFAIAHAVLHSLSLFSVIPAIAPLLKLVSQGAAVGALVVLAVALSFFTPTALARNRTDFEEYAVRRAATDPQAALYQEMLATAGPGHYRAMCVIWERSIDPRIPIAAFFVVWGVVFCAHFLGDPLVPEGRGEPGAAGQSLLPQDRGDAAPGGDEGSDEEEESYDGTEAA